MSSPFDEPTYENVEQGIELADRWHERRRELRPDESLHLEGCALPGDHEGPCDEADGWNYSTETVSPHDSIIASPRYKAALELIAETPYWKFSDPITYSSFVRDIARNALGAVKL